MEKELLRAMEVISKIAINADQEQEDSQWGSVYMIAHSFSENCSHPEWRKEIGKAENSLKDF